MSGPVIYTAAPSIVEAGWRLGLELHDAVILSKTEVLAFDGYGRLHRWRKGQWWRLAEHRTKVRAHPPAHRPELIRYAGHQSGRSPTATTERTDA